MSTRTRIALLIAICVAMIVAVPLSTATAGKNEPPEVLSTSAEWTPEGNILVVCAKRTQSMQVIDGGVTREMKRYGNCGKGLGSRWSRKLRKKNSDKVIVLKLQGTGGERTYVTKVKLRNEP